MHILLSLGFFPVLSKERGENETFLIMHLPALGLFSFVLNSYSLFIGIQNISKMELNYVAHSLVDCGLNKPRRFLLDFVSQLLVK